MSKQVIVSLSKGTPKRKLYNGAEYSSGIWKEAADSLLVGSEQISGDQVANPQYHGGPDRVVCLYPFEHYAHWRQKLGVELPVSAFGENISATNMREDQVCIGDVFQIGEAILQISQGRYPCATINKRNEQNQLLKQIIETGYTGYFFRVLQEGRITADAAIEKLSSHPRQVTVAAIHHLYFHEASPNPETICEMLSVEELAAPWRKKLEEKLLRITQG